MATKKEHEHEHPDSDEGSSVTVVAAKGEKTSAEPADLGDYEGKYKNQSGEEFGLKIVEDDPHGRTHKMKNKEHYWEGTEAEFKQQFEK